MSLNEPFSRREGFGADHPLIYDNAPEELRNGLREVLIDLGYNRPVAQDVMLCKALRRFPRKYSLLNPFFPSVYGE